VRHWKRLGLKRVPGTTPPILYGDTIHGVVWDRIVEFSAWDSPTTVT
jgi:hypothetical protein